MITLDKAFEENVCLSNEHALFIRETFIGDRFHFSAAVENDVGTYRDFKLGSYLFNKLQLTVLNRSKVIHQVVGNLDKPLRNAFSITM